VIRFRSMIAPVEKPTGDGRVLAADTGTSRATPLPWLVKFATGGGHTGAVTVARIEKIERRGSGADGQWWAEGHYLDPKIVPQVPQAVYLAKMGVHNPSVDMDSNMTVQVVPHPTQPGKQMGRFTDFCIVGVTQLPIPAFGETRIFCNDDSEKALLASAGLTFDDFDDEWAVFTVNSESWKHFGIAPRDQPFDADNAIQRIAAWAGIGSTQPDVNKYASAFLWRDGSQTGDSFAQDSFRLPMIDIINGNPMIVYHAVYAAAALISGAHGGLPNVPDADKKHLTGVIQEIYTKFREAFNDPGMPDPFGAGDPNRGNQPARGSAPAQGQGVAMNLDEFTEITATVTDFAGRVVTEFAGKKTPSMPYGDVTYADPGYQEDGKKRYPLDSEEHCRAAWSYINQEKNAAQYTPEQLKQIKGRIQAALKKYGVQTADQSGDMGLDEVDLMSDVDTMDNSTLPAILASVAPVAPPRIWFDNPGLAEPTPLTITDEGRVFGHLAEWKVCHLGIGNSCVVAPKSRTNYKHFRLGPVVTDDGSTVHVGKITLGTGHAHPQWGIMPARDHYDNSGWAAAVVNVGEDPHGIWVSGALTANMTPERVAELRRSPLSGDWREVNGNFELIAALAVNNPGFPVLHVHDGKDFSLVAAGVVDFGMDEEDEDEEKAEGYVSDDEDMEGEPEESSEDKKARLAKILAAKNEHDQSKRAAKFEMLTAQADVPNQQMNAAQAGQMAAAARQRDAQFITLDGVPDLNPGREDVYTPAGQGQPALPAGPQGQPAQPVQQAQAPQQTAPPQAAPQQTVSAR
jgi:hypothetical protein